MPKLRSESRDRYYNPLVLWVYDFFVQILTNSFWWRCPTKTVLVPFWVDNSSYNHMEIGAGTGYFLRQKLEHEKRKQAANSDVKPWPQRLTIVDFHTQCLDRAVKAIEKDSPIRPDQVIANILEPIPLAPTKFDSISFMYVLHCIPVPPAVKARAFANIKPFLSDNGTFFGSTVLGTGVYFNPFAWFLMWLYNYIGMFGNWDDAAEDFEKALKENFEEVETQVVGTVFLWTARKPKN